MVSRCWPWRRDNVGKVEVDLKIVIPERVVLGRVKDLEQRSRRITAPACRDLVDLVEQDHRVHGLRFTKRAYYSASLRADIGASMPADLRLIANAT